MRTLKGSPAELIGREAWKTDAYKTVLHVITKLVKDITHKTELKHPTFMERFLEASCRDATELEVFAMAQIIIRVLKYTTTFQPIFPESQWELHENETFGSRLRSGMRDCTTASRLIISNSD